MNLFWLRRRDRATIIGDAPVRVAVEAAVRQGWDAIIGAEGTFIGMTGFGASAPDKDLYKYFGITPEMPRLRWQLATDCVILPTSRQMRATSQPDER